MAAGTGVSLESIGSAYELAFEETVDRALATKLIWKLYHTQW